MCRVFSEYQRRTRGSCDCVQLTRPCWMPIVSYQEALQRDGIADPSKTAALLCGAEGMMAEVGSTYDVVL